MLESSPVDTKPGDLKPTAPVREHGSTLPGWLVLLTLVLFLAVYFFIHRHDLNAAWLEDLPVYQAAVHAYMAGLNPYAQTVGFLHFVYSPIVLYPASLLARLMPGESEWTLLTCIHLACVLAAPLVLARYFLRQPWLTPLMAMLIWFAEPGFTGMRALYSANVAPSLYLFALLAAVPGLRRNRWHWFYAVVLLAGAIKITLVVLLILPLLAGRKQWFQSIAIGVAVGAASKAQQVLMPSLYAGYKEALVQQLAVLKLYGYGIFGVAAIVEQKLHHGIVGVASYAVHLLFVALLMGLLFWLKRRGADTLSAHSTEADTLWIGVILMAAIVINPRVLHYDMYLALFAAFVVLATAFRLQSWQLIGLLIVFFLPAQIAFPHSRPWLASQLWQLGIVLFAMAVSIAHLCRATRSASAPAAPSVDTPKAVLATALQ